MNFRSFFKWLTIPALTVTLPVLAGFSLAQAQESQASRLDQRVLTTVFSGQERLHYSVSWSGGVKIGDIFMEIVPDKAKKDGYLISAKVSDYGPFKLIYPVDDTFRCLVSGPLKLPHRYEVVQREGFSGRETRRMTWYDQHLKYVRYQKNDETPERFDLEGTTYNEFASFIITRALAFTENEEIVVPTFADKKRHEVRVALLAKEQRPTLFGDKETLKVQPKMQFKGLYDKDGDTVLWLTNDSCRVPVEINSRIVVGSLVAELVEYANPACTELRVPPQAP